MSCCSTWRTPKPSQSPKAPPTWDQLTLKSFSKISKNNSLLPCVITNLFLRRTWNHWRMISPKPSWSPVHKKGKRDRNRFKQFTSTVFWKETENPRKSPKSWMCFVSVEIVEQGRGQLDVKTPLNKASSKPANIKIFIFSCAQFFYHWCINCVFLNNLQYQ